MAALVDDRNVGVVREIGDGAGSNHTAHVRGDHAWVLKLAGEHVIHKDLALEAVVNRDIKEALDLLGVKVNGEYTVNTVKGEQVSNDLGSDGDAVERRRRSSTRYPRQVPE